MKKVFFLCAFACLLSLNLNAQDTSEFKKETIEFIRITGAADAFENAISQIGMQVPAANKVVYTSEAKATLTDLYEKLADIYMAEFTKDEIKDLVKFYNTDLGKKLASKQLLLAQKGMSLGQTWGMEVGAIAQKYK